MTEGEKTQRLEEAIRARTMVEKDEPLVTLADLTQELVSADNRVKIGATRVENAHENLAIAREQVEIASDDMTRSLAERETIFQRIGEFLGLLRPPPEPIQYKGDDHG